MNNEEHIEITQKDGTVRYWCPIDVPEALNAPENEVAYAVNFCGWTAEQGITYKQAICQHLRGLMSEEYKTLFINNAITTARTQATELINQIL